MKILKLEIMLPEDVYIVEDLLFIPLFFSFCS